MPKPQLFISLSLVLLTYSAFGWIVAQSSASLSYALVEQGKTWGWLLDRELVSFAIHLLAVSSIFLITAALMAPVGFITIFFGSWFKSDTKALLSILSSAFAVVVIIRWLAAFFRFLVLVCATILGLLELREAGYNEWQALAILNLACLGGFGIGIIIFRFYGYA